MIILFYTDIQTISPFFPYLIQFVSKERREKISKILNFNDKILSLGAELLIMYGYYYTENKVLNINSLKKNKYGKPYLNNDKIYFNISHSNNLIICAFSNTNIGIDIEYSDKKIPSNVLNQCFSSLEKELVFLDSNRFYELWTLKEAYIKFLGKGLAYPINEVTFKISDKNYMLTKNTKQDLKINLYTNTSFFSGYVFSIVSIKTHEFFSEKYVSKNDLLNLFEKSL